MRRDKSACRHDPVVRLQKKLSAQLARTSIDYQLLQADDRVLVAMSGGKDSYALLLLLDAIKARLPFACQWVPVFVDQKLPDMDITPLRNWLQQRGGQFEIVSEDTHRVVVEKTHPDQLPCPLCSRLRRGILYSTAARLKCNKIALGHHRDDALATFMMNLFYSGTLQAMPARYTTDDGRFVVIRPMIEIAERDISTMVEQQKPPILSSPFCATLHNHQREAMNKLLSEQEKQHPQLRQVMLAALKRVKPSHLLDPRLHKHAPAQADDELHAKKHAADEE